MSNLHDKGWTNSSPPLQGRGRGWGLSNKQLETLGDRARDMRNQPTPAERRLWTALSRSQLGGFKFRRQAVIGNAIADFLCPKKGLIVEVDGETHVDAAADARRTAALEALGYQVARVTNLDVMQNLDGVLRHVLDVLEGLPDRHNPHPNPSPEGEGLLSDASEGPVN